MAQQQVTYLGYEITAAQQTLGTARKEAICQTPQPQTAKELCMFLGMIGWCCLWIYNYRLLVKPLHELLKSSSKNLVWNREADKAFHQLKKRLMDAPALGLPDITRPVWLLSHEKQGIALGFLVQNLGAYQRAVV